MTGCLNFHPKAPMHGTNIGFGKAKKKRKKQKERLICVRIQRLMSLMEIKTCYLLISKWCNRVQILQGHLNVGMTK